MREYLTEKALAYARALVQIESVTFREKACAKKLADILRGLGFQVALDEESNLVARLKGSEAGAPALLFIGHHDTVEPGDPEEWDYPPLEAVVENGNLHGRGSNDEKGGLAGFLAAAEYMVTRGERPRGDILLVSTREETADLDKRGILQVLRRAGYLSTGPGKTERPVPVPADQSKAGPGTTGRPGPAPADLLQALRGACACLCLEPTETKIMLGHRGRAVADFTVSGRAAHAGMPARGVNAIAGAAALITAIQEMTLPGSDPAWQGTQAVTMISGGTGENIVPEECRFTVDRRILEGENEDTVAAEYRRVIHKVQEQDPGIRVEMQTRPPYYAALTDREDDFVHKVRSIVGSLGLPEEPEIFPGHTDAEWVINDMGIPCVIFGPGSLTTAHTTREFVPVEELGICGEVYYRMMRG